MANKNGIPLRILVVDNESDILEIFTEVLDPVKDAIYAKINQHNPRKLPRQNFEVITSLNAAEAIGHVQSSLEQNKPFAVTFIDINLEKGKEGISAAREIRALDSEIEIVMITGFPAFNTEEAICSILPSHKILFVRKPLYPQEIYHFSVSLADKWQNEKELKGIKEDLERKVESRSRELELLNQEIQSDAEERKSIEDDLKLFRLTMDLSSDSVFIIDPDTGKFLDVNKKACDELGYEYSELMQLSVMDVAENFKSRDAFVSRMGMIRNKSRGQLFLKGMNIRKDDTKYPVEVTGSLKCIGSRDYLLVATKDISQWQKITDELTASKTHLAMAQQIAGLGSWELSVDGKLLHWSEESFRIFGSTPRENPPSTESILQRFHPDDVESFLAAIYNSFETQTLFKCTHRLVMPDNDIKYIRQRGKVFCDESGKITKIIGTCQDVSQLKQDESEMKRLRNLLTNIINSMPSMLIGVDIDGKITLWNNEAQRFTGISPLKALNNPLDQIFSELTFAAEMVKQAVSSQKTLKETKVQVGKGNKASFFNIMVYPLITKEVEGAVILVEDVTERARMEDIMLQTEKMFTVGGLAAGMAHEINNPLAGIIQNLQVMRNRLSSKLPKNAVIAIQSGTTIEHIEEYIKQRKLNNTIEKVLEAGHRAAKIVENMLNFSYKAGTLYSMHDLAMLLDKTLDLARNEYDLKKRFDFKKIKIIKEYSSEVSKVPCEENTIQQVFFNILKNGAQAMAGNLQNNANPCFCLRVLPEDEFVRVEIEDNGPGVDEQIQQRIFEPFFTTKEVGVGTGLGLAVSYFIITENHGGTITVESKPGKGAMFVIRLPV